MSQRSKNTRSKQPKKVVQLETRRDGRMHRAMELVMPTEPNQYGSTALIPSDFNSKLTIRLAPYNTIGNQNFFWRSSYDGTDQRQVAGNDLTGGLYFVLSNISGYASFATVFDQYRLRCVSVTFSPRATAVYSATDIQPRLWTCFDYDDATAIARSAVEQYDSCVLSPPGTGVVRTIVPRMALAAYSGAFTSYANVEDQWLDISSVNVQHYGVKFVIEAGAAAQTNLVAYALSYTAYWEFRSTR